MISDGEQVHVAVSSEFDAASQTKADFESAAREELQILIELLRNDAGLIGRLGDPQIEALGGDGYFFRLGSRKVAVRPGLVGELHETDPTVLLERGTGPAIFVNIVECGVYFDRLRTQNTVLHELADQLKA